MIHLKVIIFSLNQKTDEDIDAHYQVSCPPTLFISFVLQYLLYDSLSANDVKHAQSYFRGKKFFLCVFSHLFLDRSLSFAMP